MKSLITTLLLLSLPVLSHADELFFEIYPKGFPSIDLEWFINEHGHPDQRKIEIATEHQKIAILSHGRKLYQPTLPPDLADSEEILFCDWKETKYGAVKVWFRRQGGEWISFWNFIPTDTRPKIFCGIHTIF